MKNLKWLSVPLALVATITLATNSAHADGSDKKNRLCRHLKMIYLLNGGSNVTAANQIKEKYGAMTCGEMSFNLDSNGKGTNNGKPNTDGSPTITAVTKTDGPKPTISATDTAQ